MLRLLWLIPALPFAGFVILALIGPRLSRRGASIVGVGSAGLSAAITLAIAGTFIASPPPGQAFTETLWVWINVADFTPTIGLRLDSLSLIMILVVTFVGFLIHLYSVEFMIDEEGYSRFFAYMNLFVGAMLTLVLADNLLLLYLGWEGVGLCSYLLIGFWYRDPENGRAARKAFIVTRVGDAAMAVGLWGSRRRRGTAPGRGGGQVGPVAAANLATRCYGRSQPGQRSDPCRDHGHGWRVPHRPHKRVVQPGAVCDVGGRHHWVAHAAVGRVQRPYPTGNQTCPGLLDHQPDRLHVSGARRRRLVGRHLSLYDPRLFQSPPLSRCRYDHHPPAP
jgi:hypothetical protein